MHSDGLVAHLWLCWVLCSNGRNFGKQFYNNGELS